MKYLNQEIEHELTSRGAKLVRFVSIAHLDEKQNRKLPNAIVFAFPLTADYVTKVVDTPDYVQARIEDHYNFDDDEYTQTEHKAGEVADELTRFIAGRGYQAKSQSDAGLVAEEVFNFEVKESVLPHKKVALLGGLGWIGRNNLLITPEYGAAQCLGTVLTDAPLETVLHEPFIPKCGNCNICRKICEKQVLKGKTWSPAISRDEIVDVYGCSTCLKCLVHCPWTQKHTRKSAKKINR